MMRRLRAAAIAAAAALAAGFGWGGPAGAGPAPAALWVNVTGEPTATLLHLQAGFATVLRADHRVDTVAVGDPRLVTATPVRRGQDAYDLILQPQSETGTTNMVVWYGDLATVWTLEIGPGHRSADIVYVRTVGVANSPKVTGATPWPPLAGATHPGPEPTAQDSPSVSQSPPALLPKAPLATRALPAIPAPMAAGPDKPRPTSPGQMAGTAGPPLLEVRQARGDVVGIFQVFRAPDDVLIRYRITNGGASDLMIRPGGVLVRVNGRVVPYGMARDSIDRGRPEILPRGATETGVIDVPSTAPHRVQLILSLFPMPPLDEATEATLPLTFQAMFTGVDRLAVASP